MTAYYKEKLEQGLTYQDFVTEKLYEAGIPVISYSSKRYQHMIGENKAGIEIKNDTRFRETGNFYIETAEKSREEVKNFTNSGVFRDDNTWLYIIGDYQEIFIFSKRQLGLVKDKFKRVEIATSKGFLLPVDYARGKLALKIISCDKEGSP